MHFGASEETVVFQSLGVPPWGEVLFTLRQARQDFVA
ncbi:protein of unknown function [Bradyrhizobium vignae]|uniref:Uncharacterized protein n=1 Tax=Bradyrhizobium vignae TaxID=1549949 RepID=A0A2U3PZM2_9BRAD|nr:protein of unknown function [Bradyrhizobium vignae]